MEQTTITATGYDPNEHFFASRFRQGGREIYSLDFSVRELVTFLPKPDPEKVLDASSTQRRIIPAHAKGFGDYVKDSRDWVSPALLLRAPPIFEFRRYEAIEAGTTQFGLLAVPKDARSEIEIVDGQHRTLGFHLAWEALSGDISRAREHLARSRQTDEPALVGNAEKDLAHHIARRDELAAERVLVQIVVVETREAARRIFLDINDNAKGITGAVKSRFDDRKVVSRALNKVLADSDLLEGRVDLEQDRVLGKSKYLLGAKHVADILRALVVGNGRVGKRLESELDEAAIAQEFGVFSEVLQRSFPALAQVVGGTLSTAQLRQQDLVGSNVMLRALASVWYELRREGWKSVQIAEAFAKMAPHMAAPVFADATDTWFRTGVFEPRLEGASSPRSRLQDFRTLTASIVAMCMAGEGVEWTRASASDPAMLPEGS